jgi:hypothetical protein
MWSRDFMHPIDLGHKTIADVVVYALQQSALQVAMSPYGVPDLDLLIEPLPQPMFPSNYEGKNRLCVYGEVRTALLTRLLLSSGGQTQPAILCLCFSSIM